MWLTGLPAAGKSSAAQWVAHQLEAAGATTVQLDGDRLRTTVFRDLSFDPADRRQNARRFAELAARLALEGAAVVASTVSPSRCDRRMAKEIVRQAGVPFVEVWIDTPVEVCRNRDPKGLYALARQGMLVGLTGWDAPYEAPVRPAIRFDGTCLRSSRDRARLFDALSAQADAQPDRRTAKQGSASELPSPGRYARRLIRLRLDESDDLVVKLLRPQGRVFSQAIGHAAEAYAQLLNKHSVVGHTFVPTGRGCLVQLTRQPRAAKAPDLKSVASITRFIRGVLSLSQVLLPSAGLDVKPENFLMLGDHASCIDLMPPPVEMAGFSLFDELAESFRRSRRPDLAEERAAQLVYGMQNPTGIRYRLIYSISRQFPSRVDHATDVVLGFPGSEDLRRVMTTGPAGRGETRVAENLRALRALATCSAGARCRSATALQLLDIHFDAGLILRGTPCGHCRVPSPAWP